MELNPRKCAMATTDGLPGLQLRLYPHLGNPWHWVPAADSVPYLGLQLPPDGEFTLQRKHRLCLAAVHHPCLNTLALPKVVQDVILAILGGVSSTSPPSSPTTPTPCATWTTSRSRSRRTGRGTLLTPRGQPTGQPDPGAHAGANTVPAGHGGPRRHARPPPLGLGARLGHQDVLGHRRRTWHLPRGHYPVLEFAALAGGDWVKHVCRALAALGVGIYNVIACPRAAHVQLQSLPGQRRHAAYRQAAAPRHVPPDGATQDALARAPQAAPPLPRQRPPMASGGAGVPKPVR